VRPDDAGPALITRSGRNVLELQTKRDAVVAARCKHRRDAPHSFLIKPTRITPNTACGSSAAASPRGSVARFTDLPMSARTA